MTKDMYVKSNWFFILYKALLVIAAAYGLHFHMAAGKWGDFNYYTVLSNVSASFISLRRWCSTSGGWPGGAIR